MDANATYRPPSGIPKGLLPVGASTGINPDGAHLRDGDYDTQAQLSLTAASSIPVRSKNSCGVVVIPQQPAEPLSTAHRTSGLVLSDFPGWKQQSVAFPRRAKNSAEIERGVLWPVELKENKWIRLLASFGNDFRHDSRRRHRS